MSDAIPLALGALIALRGLTALAFGVYALARVERGQRGNASGPFEHDSRITLGIRVVTGGALALVLGALVLRLRAFDRQARRKARPATGARLADGGRRFQGSRPYPR